MSDNDLGLVRQAYEAWNKGDLEAALDFLDAEVELVAPPDFPEARTVRGRDEVKRWVDEFLDVWEEVGVEPVQFLDAGAKVVVLVRYFGRGKGSGAPVRGAIVDAHVWTLRDGKGVRFQMYQGTDQALQDVGLDPGEATRARKAPRTSPSGT